jgi:hypothetical protein
MTYGNHLVVMPHDYARFELYCKNLGYADQEDIQKAWERHNDTEYTHCLYVSAKHFDPVDIADDGSLRPGNTRSTRDFSIRGSRRDFPTEKVPASTGYIISNDPRYINNGSSSSSSSSRESKRGTKRAGDDMNANDIDRLISKSKSKPVAPAAAAEAPPPPLLRPPLKLFRYEASSKPKCYSMIADPYNLVRGMLEINAHARECGTELSHASRHDVQYYGLCGSITFRCSKGEGCCHWPVGLFRMYTQNPISTQEYGKSHDINDEILQEWKNFMPKNEYRANILHATGESITSVMPAESEKFIVQLGLKVRSPQVRAQYRKHIIRDTVKKIWMEEEKRVFQKYKRADGNVFCYDGAHSCVRDAQHTLGASILAGPNVIAAVDVLSDGHAASREDRILRKQIPYMQNELGYILKAGVTDQSASGIKIIRDMLPSGQAIADLWHTIKSLPKLVETIVSKFEESVLALYKNTQSLYNSELGRSPSLLEFQEVLNIAMKNFKIDHKFDSLFEKFRVKGYGMTKWEECAKDKNVLDAVGSEFGLLNSFASTAADPRLAKFPMTGQPSFRLEMQSLKLLKGMVHALVNDKEVSDGLINIAEEVSALPKAQKHGAKKERLIDLISQYCNIPTSWKVGSFDTVNSDAAFRDARNAVIELVNEKKKGMISSPAATSSKEVTMEEKKVLKEINLNWSKAEIKKGTNVACMEELNTSVLNKVQLTALAAHLNIDTSLKLAELKKLCGDRLNSALRVVTQTLSKACALLRERLSGGPSSLRSYFSALCRNVNDFFGPFNREFKTWWVKQGMRSWGRHCCDDHSTCSGYSWYTTCHIIGPAHGTPQAEGDFSSASQAKLKISDYENNFPGITLVFQSMVTVIVTNKTFETKLYDASLYAHTFANESFHHSVQVMVSQTIGITHEFYELRVYVTALEFNWQREWKLLGQGMLRRNKHSTTLSRSQHLPSTTGPRLEITRRVLGPLFSDGGAADPKGIFTGWFDDKQSYLKLKRENRQKFITEATEKDRKEIEIMRTVCPVKSEELINEGSGNASTIAYHTRAPLPFLHTEERELGPADKETLLKIGARAREFNLSIERRRQKASQLPVDGALVEVNDEDADDDVPDIVDDEQNANSSEEDDEDGDEEE